MIRLVGHRTRDFIVQNLASSLISYENVSARAGCTSSWLIVERWRPWKSWRHLESNISVEQLVNANGLWATIQMSHSFCENGQLGTAIWWQSQVQPYKCLGYLGQRSVKREGSSFCLLHSFVPTYLICSVSKTFRGIRSATSQTSA